MANAHHPLASGRFTFAGYLGERVDTIARARITTASARALVYPETEEAFRARVDDRLRPGIGMWQGEFWGKYVLSVVAAYEYYRDPALREFAAGAAHAVIATQDTDGYIGTYHDSSFLERRTWNVWGRKYTLWALLDVHRITGDAALLEAARRLADHLMGQVGPRGRPYAETGMFNGLPSSSILTPIVRLYRATGDSRYLDYARSIVDQWGARPGAPPDIVTKGLEGDPIHTWFADPDQWAKSYEFISCVEGLVDLYEVTGEPSYLRAAQNIHRALVDWERSPVGSVSFDDKLVGSRYLRNTVAEICDIVYWNRLSFRLLCVTGDAIYADEIERSLYNGLLVGASRDGSWGIRRLRLTREHIEAHRHCDLEHHQCCVDNLPRGLFQAAKSTLLTDGTAISLALLNPGEGDVQLDDGGRVRVRCTGSWPYGDELRIEVVLQTPAELDLRIRIPGGLDRGARSGLRVDNAPPTRVEGGWAIVRRRWAPGVAVSIQFAEPLRVEWFEPALPASGMPRIPRTTVSRHEERWPRLGFAGEAGQSSSLTEHDVEPDERAGVLFHGPIALGLDLAANGMDPSGRSLPALSTENLSDASLRMHTSPDGPLYELRHPSVRGWTLTPFDRLGSTWSCDSSFTVWTVVDGRPPNRDGSEPA